MRYFLSIDARLIAKAGAFAFEPFEPVGQRGGSWFGVLAVADEAAASALAEAISRGENPGIDEISEEAYQREKKKLTGHSSSSADFQPQRNQTPGAHVAPAEHPGSLPPTTNQPMITAVTLLSGSANPPHETLLEQPAIKRGARRHP